MFKNIQRLFAEMVHNPFCHGGSNAINESGSKKLFYFLCSIRFYIFNGVALELHAKTGMPIPASPKEKTLAAVGCTAPVSGSGNLPGFLIFK